MAKMQRMSIRQVERLVGIMILGTDEFRAELFKDPIAAGKSVGIRVGALEASYIRNLKRQSELNQIAARFKKWSGRDRPNQWG